MLISTGNTSALLTQTDLTHSLVLEIPTKHGVVRFSSKPVAGSDVIVVMSKGQAQIDMLYVVEDMASGPHAFEALRKFLGTKQQDMYKGVVEHVHSVAETAYRSVVVKLEIPDVEQPYFVHYFGLDFYAVAPDQLKWDKAVKNGDLAQPAFVRSGTLIDDTAQ